MEYRKNMSLRIGVIAAVIALITLVGISGTFAKYVYQSDGTGSGNNQARVAKWGIAVTSSTEDTAGLFKKEYVAGEDSHNIALSTTNDCIIAPGTSNEVSLADMFTISGKPEVNTKLSLSDAAFNGFDGEEWKLDAATRGSDQEFYCPIKITITSANASTTFCGLDYESGTAFTNALNDSLSSAAGSQIIAAGTDLSTSVPSFLTNTKIKWEWDFTGTTRTAAKIQQSDKYDTYLGNSEAAAAEARLFSFSAKITAEQTQEKVPS